MIFARQPNTIFDPRTTLCVNRASAKKSIFGAPSSCRLDFTVEAVAAAEGVEASQMNC